MSVQTGKVKFFNNAKGFGFIVPNDGSKDIFVHHTQTDGHLKEGDEVEYETEQGKKGLNAINVEKI